MEDYGPKLKECGPAPAEYGIRQTLVCAWRHIGPGVAGTAGASGRAQRGGEGREARANRRLKPGQRPKASEEAGKGDVTRRMGEEGSSLTPFQAEAGLGWVGGFAWRGRERKSLLGIDASSVSQAGGFSGEAGDVPFVGQPVRDTGTSDKDPTGEAFPTIFSRLIRKNSAVFLVYTVAAILKPRSSPPANGKPNVLSRLS